MPDLQRSQGILQDYQGMALFNQAHLSTAQLFDFRCSGLRSTVVTWSSLRTKCKPPDLKGPEQ
jgi:hypothetical protein